jgi:mannose-6-phosphate isomerase-like protein (cupin superfamily)
MTELANIETVKTISKPWGYEKWIQEGSSTFPYVLKQLRLNAGKRTSLQVHKFKSESSIVLEGTGILLTYSQNFDCEKFLRNGYSEEEIEHIKNNLTSSLIEPGSVIHTPPGVIHRMIATTDLLYIEASTTELDDVIRLHDDNNRQHGRIDGEHH